MTRAFGFDGVGELRPRLWLQAPELFCREDAHASVRASANVLINFKKCGKHERSPIFAIQECGNTPQCKLRDHFKSPPSGVFPRPLWVQGYLAHQKTPTPLGPPQDHGHRPTVGTLGGAFSYLRGTPVSGLTTCSGQTHALPEDTVKSAHDLSLDSAHTGVPRS